MSAALASIPASWPINEMAPRAYGEASLWVFLSPKR